MKLPTTVPATTSWCMRETARGPRSSGYRRQGRAIRAVVPAFVLVALLLSAACSGLAAPEGRQPAALEGSTVDTTTIEVHRSAYCDCCGVYEAYLSAEGFTVESIVREDVEVLKEDLGIPFDLGSCHTSLVGGYFVEGHVPVAAIRKLLDEQPAIDGIALPGMPAGSPGMGGDKDADWVIYAIAGDEITVFLTI